MAKIPKGAADEIAELAAKAMKQLMESKGAKTVVNKVDDAASGAANAVKEAIASLRGRNKLGQIEFDFTSDNFKMLPRREQAAIRRQINAETQAARGDKAAAEYKVQKATNRKAKTDQVDKMIDTVWSVESQKGYGRPALIRQIEGKQKIIESKGRITEDTAGALDFAVEKRVRKEITKFKEDGYILDKSEIKELVKDAWAFELNQATNGLRANTSGLSTRIKNLAKLSNKEIDDAAARIAYRQQTNNGKAGNSVLPDYMAERVRSKKARDLGIARAKDLILETERTAAAALKADAKRGRIITNRGPKVKTGPTVESEAAMEKRLSALDSERKLIAAQEANKAKPTGLKDIPRTPLKMTQEELRAVKPMPSDSTYQKMKDSLDPTKKSFQGSTNKPSQPLRNARGETTEELNARLQKNREKVARQQLDDIGDTPFNEDISQVLDRRTRAERAKQNKGRR
jgi:hypothetical protein